MNGRFLIRVASLTLVPVALIVVSCENESGLSLRVTKKNFCSEVAKVVCNNVFQCCTGAQLEDVLGVTLTTSEAQCRKDMELKCQEANAPLLFALDKGTVTLDGPATTACLKSMLVQDTCFLFAPNFPYAEECNQQLLQGVQGVNKDCVDSVECVPDAYCGPDRKCRALPREGQECDNAGPKPCASGLYCAQDNTCQPLRKAGEECDEFNLCEPSLFCDTIDPTMESTCKSRKALNASCRGDKECISGYCIPGLCADGNVCYRDEDCEGRCRDSGEVCSSDDDCPGTCDISGIACEVDWDCPEINERCKHSVCDSSCQGKPICGERYEVFDYCEMSMKLIERFP